MELWVLLVDVVVILLTAAIIVPLHRILISTKEVSITKTTQKATLGMGVMLIVIMSSSTAIAVFTYSFSVVDNTWRVILPVVIANINFVIQIVVGVNSDVIHNSIKRLLPK